MARPSIELTEKSTQNRWRPFGTSVLLVCLSLLLVITTPSLGRPIKDFFITSFTRRPERLTELFFTDPSQLPTTFVDAQSLSVRFVIRNHEGHLETYHYRVYANTTPKAPVRTASIADGQYQTIGATVTMPTGSDRVQVVVELVDLHQSIHFWVERTV